VPEKTTAEMKPTLGLAPKNFGLLHSKNLTDGSISSSPRNDRNGQL
jgi:hypothetical protein